jgi:hypothetical protein
MLAFLLSIFLVTASADENSCVQCCQQSGLISCPTQVRVFGDGSVATPESGGWRVIGLWWLDCAGFARFESGGTVVINHKPRPGEILRLAYPTATVSCFGGHCALPRGGCMVAHDQGQNFAVANCESLGPLTASQMMVPGTVSIPEAPTGSVQIPPTAPHLDTRLIEVEIDLPAPPGSNCDSSDLLRAQSRRQQEAGDQARVESRYQEAADRYQAALSMDPCNAFAWHAMGQLSINGGQLETAIQALRVATRLVPGHYGAFTTLGEAYERNQRLELASEAYHMALSIRPQHKPALEGLARIQSPR